MVTSLQRLKETTEKIGSAIVRRPPPLEKYLIQWIEYVKGNRAGLDAAAIRCLCWEPQICISDVFVDYVMSLPNTLSARSIIGLVHSCHIKWEVSSNSLKNFVRNSVLKYKGPNRILRQWSTKADLIMPAKGPIPLAKYVIDNNLDMEAISSELNIAPQSRFLQITATLAFHMCLDQLRSPERSRLFIKLLQWKGWAVEEFKTQIEKIILHRDFLTVRESFKSLVLAHKDLGDPRLPKNKKNWISISESALNRFVEMLCREDIVFFFDYVYSIVGDRQQRKEFWLRYISKCIASRPLLRQSDWLRLKSKIGDKMSHLGEMRSTENSAFMLDFGEITVVEFSKIGACFIYESSNFKKVIPDFWSSRPFTEGDLKDRNRVIERIIHRRGWKEDAKRVLAQWGIRPGGAS